MNCDKRKIRNDILLVAILLVVVMVSGVVFLLSHGEGDTVFVTVNGQSFGEYSLHKEMRVEIVTEYGSNTLVIRDGKAFVEAASCPDGICVAHRPISRNSETIACKPNRVAVVVRTTGADSSDVDVIS